MKKFTVLILFASFLITLVSFRLYENNTSSNLEERDSIIQLALLLDTSNSMDGLIEQAKAKLWSIVNDMAETQLRGEKLDIEIALYEYGNDDLSVYNNYIRQLSSFTTDIDDISEKLFALNTNGGQEYCGAVIRKSLSDLNWKPRAAYKVMFIAGNESFAQGPIPFYTELAQAREKDIIVNTIFCGSSNQGIKLKWKEGARQGNGDFFVINQNEEIKYIQTPQDEKISALNRYLNDTYVPYGKGGQRGYEKLKDQDGNASKYGKSNMASRAIFKSRSQYNNASWDLIDAYEQSEDILKETDKLPDAYKDLSISERTKKVEALKAKRNEIKRDIKQLNHQRSEYIKEMRKEESTNGLEDSMLKSLQQQMNKRGIHKELRTDLGAQVDYAGFGDLAKEVKAHRASRLVDVDDFIERSKDPKTIILDTRSEWAFKGRHLKGAVHLNFSDFTADKLAELIPDKNTPILIYCNNNFFGDPMRMALKSTPLALNIPTFINLYGYGYKNVYELKNYVSVDDNRFEFEGTGLNSINLKTAQIK